MKQTSAFLRTDKAIMMAFIHLLKEKSFDKITVQEILETTPVTRGTFYAHYKDKYEIAERMLEIFLHIRNDVRYEITKHSAKEMTHITKKSYEMHKELVQALSKIKTETVDLRQTLINEFVEEYLNEKPNSPIIEAKIYAQVRSELEISILTEETVPLTFDEQNQVFIDSFLKLLRIPNDKEIEYAIKKKIDKNFK